MTSLGYTARVGLVILVAAVICGGIFWFFNGTLLSHQTYNIDVIFNDAVIPSGCADHIYDSGYAVVDPSCGTQYLETQPAFPSAMMLGQPTPNPTNAAITVQYDVATEGPVTIDAVDAQGTIVATLVHDSRKPGYYSASLDANALPSGAYLLRMAAANYQSAKKFVIQR